MIPKAYFSQIRAMITKFIWASKRPRISRALLTLPKKAGGVAAPDLYRYYQAAQLGRIIDWSRHGQHKLWNTIEQQVSPVPLNRVVWSYTALPTSIKTHPTIGPTLRIGCKICQNPRFSSKHLPLFPILGNLVFLPGLEPRMFGNLWEKGCFQASHFLTSDNWPTIELLAQQGGEFEIPFWQAQRVCHFFGNIGTHRGLSSSAYKI